MEESTRRGTVNAPVAAVATPRATARVVGVLFIVATVTSIIGGSLVMALPDDPDSVL